MAVSPMSRALPPSRLPIALSDAPATLSRHGGRVFVVVSLPERCSAAEPAPRAPTSTELAIAMLVLRGLSPAGIASLRGRSKRTIVNQLGSLYRKLGCASRSDLLAHFAARGADSIPAESLHAKHVA
jgi:DNA-binding CsgD family transcriptional regulator